MRLLRESLAESLGWFISNFTLAQSETKSTYSSEGPLDTPRPLKRNMSIRFPVVPTTSGSESASETRSPGFSKASVPTRSHYRVASGQNAVLLDAALRRPNITPLVGNERIRSNSESILQASQNTRNKRMGMVTRKNPDLGAVDETRTNRFSHHSRGQSHGSALRDKYSDGLRNGANNSLNYTSPNDTDRQRGTFVRRLSSLPEQKRESQFPDQVIEGVKGILYSLHQIHSHIGPLVNLIANIQKLDVGGIHHDATTCLEILDKDLHNFENNVPKTEQDRLSSTKTIKTACKACISVYEQIGSIVKANAPQLVSHADERHLRTLLILLYGSLVEARNAASSLGADTPRIQEQDHQPVSAIALVASQVRDRSATPTRERPNPERPPKPSIAIPRPGTSKSSNLTTTPQSAVPVHLNGGGRSNGRSKVLNGFTPSPVAYTPQSAGSFTSPGTPVNRSRSNTQGAKDQEQALFEHIFLTAATSVDHGLRVVPIMNERFSSCLKVAQEKYAAKAICDLWHRLISRSRFCIEMCEVLKKRLSTIKLKDPDERNATDFWKLCIKYVNSFVKLLSAVREAKELDFIDINIVKLFYPVQKAARGITLLINTSPWLHLLSEPTPQLPPQQQPFFNGKYPRSRTGSASGSSPYVNNSVPATPLSAALGPAAQATVPIAPAGSANFDRSFQGDVFQRADSLLSMQQTMLYRR